MNKTGVVVTVRARLTVINKNERKDKKLKIDYEKREEETGTRITKFILIDNKPKVFRAHAENYKSLDMSQK